MIEGLVIVCELTSQPNDEVGKGVQRPIEGLKSDDCSTRVMDEVRSNRNRCRRGKFLGGRVRVGAAQLDGPAASLAVVQ